jgi:hypothetical protein
MVRIVHGGRQRGTDFAVKVGKCITGTRGVTMASNCKPAEKNGKGSANAAQLIAGRLWLRDGLYLRLFSVLPTSRCPRTGALLQRYDTSALHSTPSRRNRSSNSTWCFSSRQVTSTSHCSGTSTIPRRRSVVRAASAELAAASQAACRSASDTGGQLQQAVPQLLLRLGQRGQRVDAQQQGAGLVVVDVEDSTSTSMSGSRSRRQSETWTPPNVDPRGSFRTALVPRLSRYAHSGRPRRGPPAAGVRLVIPARRERNVSALGAATVRFVPFAERRNPLPTGARDLCGPAAWRSFGNSGRTADPVAAW